MSSGGAPKTPSPGKQAEANVELARQQAELDRPNQVSPWGSSTWTKGAGPNDWSQTISLSPELQAQFQGLTGLAGQTLSNIDPNAIKNLPGFNPATYDPTTGTQQASDAAYQQATRFLDPQFTEQGAGLEQNLADRGIPVGSEAWTKAMDDFGRQKDFAYSGARSAAEQAGMNRQQALWGQGMQGRQQLLSESTMPLQQLSQLLGLETGAASPSFAQVQGPQIQGIQYYQQPGNNFTGQAIGAGSQMAMAALPALIAASDRQLKKDIAKVDSVDIDDAQLNVYDFRYRWEDARTPLHRGVMADEVLNVRPDAVIEFGCNWLAVDYSKLPEVSR